MYEFIIEVAGVKVLVKSRYEQTRQYMQDYIVDSDSYDLCSSVTDEEIDKAAEEAIGIAHRYHVETTALYRPIAEAMPFYNGFVFHGASISYQGKAYLFTAPSGTGKSTHISLWKKYLGEEVKIVNGDKPIITATDGKVLIHGTPWSGKERWQKNTSAELSAICLVMRGSENKIEKVDSGEILRDLIYQTYVPSNSESLLKTLELLDAVLKSVPVYRLWCDISQDAVRCSFEGMTGLDFDEFKIKENNSDED